MRTLRPTCPPWSPAALSFFSALSQPSSSRLKPRIDRPTNTKPNSTVVHVMQHHLLREKTRRSQLCWHHLDVVKRDRGWPVEGVSCPGTGICQPREPLNAHFRRRRVAGACPGAPHPGDTPGNVSSERPPD